MCAIYTKLMCPDNNIVFDLDNHCEHVKGSYFLSGERSSDFKMASYLLHTFNGFYFGGTCNQEPYVLQIQYKYAFNYLLRRNIQAHLKKVDEIRAGHCIISSHNT